MPRGGLRPAGVAIDVGPAGAEPPKEGVERPAATSKSRQLEAVAKDKVKINHDLRDSDRNMKEI